MLAKRQPKNRIAFASAHINWTGEENAKKWYYNMGMFFVVRSRAAVFDSGNHGPLITALKSIMGYVVLPYAEWNMPLV